MQETWQLSDADVADAFCKWALAQRRTGVRLITLEGLPGAGKSKLLKLATVEGAGNISFDDFLPAKASSGVSWIEQIKAAGAVDAFKDKLAQYALVIVEGSAVWPVIETVVKGFERSAVRRVYLKRMSTGGGILEWDENPEQLLDEAAKENHFGDPFMSIMVGISHGCPLILSLSGYRNVADGRFPSY